MTPAAWERRDSRPASGGKARGRVVLKLTLGLALLFAFVLAADWPNVMRFRFIAFEDRGDTLIAQSLMSKGLRPVIDFFYAYGLLALPVVRGWFAIFGASIRSEVALMVCCNLAVAWGLARFVAAIRAPRAAVILLLVAAPVMVKSVYLNVTHAIEAALLVNALAEHGRGRREVALVLLTVCAFVKPTMAYVYGLLLVIVMGVGLVRAGAGARRFLREFAPAASVGVALTLYLGVLFGFRSLLTVQIPLAGRRAYELMNYGFFSGAGRDFWRPAGANVRYYLGTPVGFWLVSTFALLGGGLIKVVRCLKSGGRCSRIDEVIITCAALHMAFICLFYGASWDWGNYAFVILIGGLALIGETRRWHTAVGAVVVVLLLVHAQSLRFRVHQWRSLSPRAETANLWATEQEREEWRRVRDLTLADGRPLIVKMAGCAELLFPGFDAADDWYVLPPLTTLLPNVERDRIRRAIEAHRALVITAPVLTLLRAAPFDAAVARHTLVWRGEYFSVYRAAAR